jgi:signal transduction histidine kinase
MRAAREADEQPWREVLLRKVLLVSTLAIAVSDILSVVTSAGRDRLFLLASIPTTLWSAVAIFRPRWPFWVRGVAMLSPMVLGVFVVYVRVGFKGNASAIATVVVILTGLLFGRRKMVVTIVAFFVLAVLVGTAMSLNVMPWHPLRVPEMDRPAIWIRATSTAVILWTITGGAVTFVVERVERSLRETREALARLQAEQRRREEIEAARRREMEALVMAQRRELATELAASAAHDFNNVLGVISLWSMVMASDRQDWERARTAIDNALKLGQSLTQQLLELFRPEPRSLTRFSLDQPILTTVETVIAALPGNVRIATDAHNWPQIEADENEIKQILYNLILNARDAMPNGGSIQVTAGLETSLIPIGVVGGSLAAGRWAMLSVKDSGSGIDPTIRDQIFDVFFTTKRLECGTGLGLATVLRIAKASGGGVAVESEAGRGATFKVYLPSA